MMPRIVLKPNSPEYQAAAKAAAQAQACDIPGCSETGTHRAPKDRSLRDYYQFCIAHAQEYNAAWDFFAGMAQQDIEHHIIQSLYGNRPTWRSDQYRGLEAELQRKIHATRFFTDEDETVQDNKPTGNPELDALATLGLQAPVTFDTIQARYRVLVKKYHPDLAGDAPQTLDLIKRINMAYTILKIAYRDEQIV
jgi:DnaJ-domain-containing protein 1